MRSQLQDKILLLMGANLVSHMTAYCAGVKVPSLTNLTEFQRPQCPAFTNSASVRSTLLEQKLEDVTEMRKSLDDTQHEFMLRTLLSAKQGIFNVSSTPVRSPSTYNGTFYVILDRHILYHDLTSNQTTLQRDSAIYSISIGLSLLLPLYL